jgi:hypothetical protein
LIWSDGWAIRSSDCRCMFLREIDHSMRHSSQSRSHGNIGWRDKSECCKSIHHSFSVWNSVTSFKTGCPVIESHWAATFFAPNKSMQMARSTKCSTLSMTEGIKFCLTQGQENRIWLERITGFTRDYYLTIVVDSPFSSFNNLIVFHLIQTLLGFLSLLSSLDILYSGLIITLTGAPRVLSVNEQSSHVIDLGSFQLLMLFSVHWWKMGFLQIWWRG